MRYRIRDSQHKKVCWCPLTNKFHTRWLLFFLSLSYIELLHGHDRKKGKKSSSKILPVEAFSSILINSSTAIHLWILWDMLSFHYWISVPYAMLSIRLLLYSNLCEGMLSSMQLNSHNKVARELLESLNVLDEMFSRLWLNKCGLRCAFITIMIVTCVCFMTPHVQKRKNVWIMNKETAIISDLFDDFRISCTVMCQDFIFTPFMQIYWNFFMSLRIMAFVRWHKSYEEFFFWQSLVQFKEIEWMWKFSMLKIFKKKAWRWNLRANSA